MSAAAASAEVLGSSYLDLLKRSLTNYHYLGGNAAFDAFRCVEHYDVPAGRWNIDRLSCPATLLSMDQLNLIEQAVRHVHANRIPGDLLEAGIWRGGAIILMRAMLDVLEIADRQVIAADSFAGIPLNTRAVNDPVDRWLDRWVASLDEVRGLIDRFGLLDDRIEFCVGFFEDSLKSLAGRRYAMIRLDSDSYDSVETSLDQLYPNLSRNGVTIIDDWHLAGCQQAVMDYRARYGIDDPIKVHDGNAYWFKQQEYRSPPAA